MNQMKFVAEVFIDKNMTVNRFNITEKVVVCQRKCSFCFITLKTCTD